jgi:predicted RNase H-like nuclease (RuvC/YqgF family)
MSGPGVRGWVLGSAGGAAGRRSRSAAAGDRVQAQENKIQQLHDQLEDLEQQVADDVQEIDTKWDAVAADIGTLSVPLERSDVNVTQLALVWLPAR